MERIQNSNAIENRFKKQEKINLSGSYDGVG